MKSNYLFFSKKEMKIQDRFENEIIFPFIFRSFAELGTFAILQNQNVWKPSEDLLRAGDNFISEYSIVQDRPVLRGFTIIKVNVSIFCDFYLWNVFLMI